MALKCPRLVIAGLSGDSGKTVTSLSLLLALRRRGFHPAVFKKGPDYIDAAWLSWASSTTCRNLDTYMVEPDDVRASFMHAAEHADIAVIEGNRGLFDGKDSAGTHSTASLARLLNAPVVLVVDCTKTTRTVAALVRGCQVFEPDIEIAGVILNQVAGERHRRIITEAIEQSCHLPVLGAIPRLSRDDALIPGRHLGLVTPAEFGGNAALADRLPALGEEHLDLDRLIEIARGAKTLPSEEPSKTTTPRKQARIGYFSDRVFTFYYPENLEALESAGAELVPISSLVDTQLPDIDALYIGGGFPETHAEQLTRNHSLRQSVKSSIDNGLPVYAECGGLIYLCESLQSESFQYPMAGVFPIALGMHDKPAGHGYTEIKVDRPNPYFEVGATLRGHEFHYSGPKEMLSDKYGCMRVTSGVGLGNGRDGLLHKNCLACYTHLHASGVSTWATTLVDRAVEYQATRRRCDQPENLASVCTARTKRNSVCVAETFGQSGVEAQPLMSGY
jgi:cobyrinic acid a,c-diamide synthase